MCPSNAHPNHTRRPSVDLCTCKTKSVDVHARFELVQCRGEAMRCTGSVSEDDSGVDRAGNARALFGDEKVVLTRVRVLSILKRQSGAHELGVAPEPAVPRMGEADTETANKR